MPGDVAAQLTAADRPDTFFPREGRELASRLFHQVVVGLFADQFAQTITACVAVAVTIPTDLEAEPRYWLFFPIVRSVHNDHR